MNKLIEESYRANRYRKQQQEDELSLEDFINKWGNKKQNGASTMPGPFYHTF